MKVVIHETVMVNELGREGVLLDLANGEYFSLDEVGMDMWKALARHDSVDAACRDLLTQYAVDEITLRNDMDAFLRSLADRSLVTLD